MSEQDATEYERIWLQGPSGTPGESVGERTWCQDKINDDDVEYVRADRITCLESQLAARTQEVERLKARINEHGTSLRSALQCWDDRPNMTDIWALLHPCRCEDARQIHI